MTTRARIYPGDGDPRHGSVHGYQGLKCRCPLCTAANTRAHYEWEHADPDRLRRKAKAARKARARRKREREETL